jgi:hypothetical protein
LAERYWLGTAVVCWSIRRLNGKRTLLKPSLAMVSPSA